MKDDDYFIWLCFLLLLYYYLLYISFFYCEYIYMRIYFIWLCFFLFSNYYLLLERILSTFSTASSVVIHTVNIFCLRLYRGLRLTIILLQYYSYHLVQYEALVCNFSIVNSFIFKHFIKYRQSSGKFSLKFHHFQHF